jgi:acetyltransferase-like isoleucine patch superfamily enzyme
MESFIRVENKMKRSVIETTLLLYADIRAKLYTKLLSPAFYSVGQGTTIIPSLRFSYLSGVTLGEHVTVHRNCWIQVLKGMRMMELKIDHPENGIGMNSTISVARKVVIEDFVFTARNVYISDHGHEYRDTGKPIAQQGIGDIREVVIGAVPGLGRMVVLPGVKIGKHCVIGKFSCE